MPQSQERPSPPWCSSMPSSAKVDEIVMVERKFQGPSNFNEQTARESAMSMLSGWEPAQ